MPLLGVTSDCLLHSQLHSSKCQADLMWYCSWPPDASTRGVHLSDILGTSENLNTLCILCFAFTEVFSTKDKSEIWALLNSSYSLWPSVTCCYSRRKAKWPCFDLVYRYMTTGDKLKTIFVLPKLNLKWHISTFSNLIGQH